MKTYTAKEARQAGITLEPLKCIKCGSLKVALHQYMKGKNGHCADCDTWQ